MYKLQSRNTCMGRQSNQSGVLFVFACLIVLMIYSECHLPQLFFLRSAAKVKGSFHLIFQELCTLCASPVTIKELCTVFSPGVHVSLLSGLFSFLNSIYLGFISQIVIFLIENKMFGVFFSYHCVGLWSFGLKEKLLEQ